MVEFTIMIANVLAGVSLVVIVVLCDELREKLKKEDDIHPAHIEGYQTADWILLDYLDFIVHVFTEKTREFYKVERLWNDGKIVEL